ncbi:MAG: hypothetical protein WBM11_01155 [Terriglobales bacterium]
MTNLLSVLGTLLVAALLCAAAFGRWKKGIPYRTMVRFSFFGVVIPFAVYAASILEHRFGVRFLVAVEEFFLVLWPGSIATMALNSSNSVSNLFFVAILILMNAGLYGLVGLCMGLAWDLVSHRPAQ